MGPDEVWQAIDTERLSLAALLEDLTEQEWEHPSLCAGWRVRDVAAHLTLAHTALPAAMRDILRARGSFDRMVHDTAVRQAELPVEEFPRRLRAMAGSRRTVIGLTPMEPLLDLLVHGQDIARPLGRRRPMPPAAAAAAATRVWGMGWPFHARRRLRGMRLTATDVPWSAGHGEPLEAPIADLLLLLTGRTTVTTTDRRTP